MIQYNDYQIFIIFLSVVELNKAYLFDDGEAKFLQKDILMVRFNSSKRVSVKDVTNIRNLRQSLIGQQPYYPIIDCRKGFVNFTSEAKAWVAVNKESAAVRLMDVLLVNNWAAKIEAQLYLRMFKPKVKTKIVTSLEDALAIIEQEKIQISIDTV